MKHLRALKLFLSILWGDFNGVKISFSSSWKVTKLIHYEKSQGTIHTIKYNEEGEYETD